MEKIIELKKVNFSAQHGKVLTDVNLGYSKGRTTAIVGPSGGGKSTVLKLSAGLLVPDDGEVLYKEENLAYMNRAENLEFRRETAFVFQDSALWANQNIYQILDLPLRIHFPKMTKKERFTRIKEVTNEVGYKRDLEIRPSRLSMGEQKLIAFARALLCKPSLLFLDEWTESLDENGAKRLINIVKEKQKSGFTIIFVSHVMRLILDLADHVIIIAEGKVSHEAPKDNIMNELLERDFLKIGIEA